MGIDVLILAQSIVSFRRNPPHPLPPPRLEDMAVRAERPQLQACKEHEEKATTNINTKSFQSVAASYTQRPQWLQRLQFLFSSLVAERRALAP